MVRKLNSTKSPKRALKIVNGIGVYLLTLSLIHVPLAGFAAQKKSNDVQTNAWVSQINRGLKISTGMYSQYQQQNNQWKQMAQMQSSMQMKFTPAMYFPHCKITNAVSDFPDGACENISDQFGYSMADQIIQAANSHDDVYTQLLSPAQNTPYPVGVKCLEDAYRKELANLNQKLNYLTTLITKVNEQDKKDKEKLQKIKDQMDDINNELNGGKGGKNASNKSKSQDISKYFNSAPCNTVLTSAHMSAGLRGVSDSMKTPTENGKSLRDMSADMITNEKSYKNQIDTQIGRMLSKINKYGIEDWVSTFSIDDVTRGGLIKFPGMEKVATQQAKDIMTAKDRATKFLKEEVDYDLPSLDGNFSSNISSFANEADTYFKKKAIHSCVTMENSTGLGLSYDQILGSIHHPATNNSGTTIVNYKAELKVILESDSFVEDKLAAIAKLDKAYHGGMVYQVAEGGSKNNYSGVQLFQEMINRCDKAYEQGNTFSTDSPSKLSDKKKVEQATKYVRELKDLESNFASSLTSAVEDELLKCDANVSTSGSCGPNSVDPSAENFCLQTSVRCSNDIQRCMKKAENMVLDREMKMKKIANTYNKAVEQIFTKKKNFLDQEAFKQVMNAEWYGKYFNNSPYQIPDGLTVMQPELAGTEYGEKLRGGGSLDMLDPNNPENLSTQLEKLKDVLTNQSKEVEQVVSTYVDSQKQAIADNQKKWNGLKDTCKTAQANYKQQVSQYNQKMAEKQQEVNKEIADSCTRYTNKPTCGDYNNASDLFDDMAKAASYYNPEAIKYVGQLASGCREKERHSEGKDDDAEESSPIAKVFELCNKGLISSPKDMVSSAREIDEATIENMVSILNDNADDTDQEITAGDLSDIIANKGRENLHPKYKNLLKKNKVINNYIESLMAATDKEASDISCSDIKSASNEYAEFLCNKDEKCKSKSSKLSEVQSLDLSYNKDNAPKGAVDKLVSAQNFNATFGDLYLSKDDLEYFIEKQSAVGEYASVPSCTAGVQGKRKVGERQMTADQSIQNQLNTILAQ